MTSNFRSTGSFQYNRVGHIYFKVYVTLQKKSNYNYNNEPDEKIKNQQQTVHCHYFKRRQIKHISIVFGQRKNVSELQNEQMH